jgi:hypothetical protein
MEQVVEKNIFPGPADNTGTNAFSKNSLGFVCAAHVI